MSGNPNQASGNVGFNGREEVTFHWQTDVGCVREANEDCFGAYVPEDEGILANLGAMAIVADGMGGAVGGAMASTMAIQSMIATYYENPGQDLERSLAVSLENANRVIHQTAYDNPQYKGMGCTCTGVVLQDDSLFFAHVGDSRGYLLRDHQLLQFTSDHSKVAQMVLDGYITPEEAEIHPQRNVLLRSVGPKPDVKVDSGRLKLQPGDRILLCSDGLCGLVTDLEMMQIMEDFGAEAALNSLINLAKERGGHDNITAQLLGYGAKKQGAPVTQAAPVTVGASETMDMPAIAPRTNQFTKESKPPTLHFKLIIAGLIALLLIGVIVLITNLPGDDSKSSETDVIATQDVLDDSNNQSGSMDQAEKDRDARERAKVERRYEVEKIVAFIRKTYGPFEKDAEKDDKNECVEALMHFYLFADPDKENKTVTVDTSISFNPLPIAKLDYKMLEVLGGETVTEVYEDIAETLLTYLDKNPGIQCLVKAQEGTREECPGCPAQGWACHVKHKLGKKSKAYEDIKKCKKLVQRRSCSKCEPKKGTKSGSRTPQRSQKASAAESQKNASGSGLAGDAPNRDATQPTAGEFRECQASGGHYNTETGECDRSESQPVQGIDNRSECESAPDTVWMYAKCWGHDEAKRHCKSRGKQFRWQGEHKGKCRSAGKSSKSSSPKGSSRPPTHRPMQ